MNEYAIGSADNIEVILDGGVEVVEYDLKQVQEQGYARYKFLGDMVETDTIRIGEHVSTAIADNIIDNHRYKVYGFCVPDYLMASFIEQYPDKTILRLRNT